MGKARGARNTLEAFDGARRAGADGVELDVRLTGDGRLAVHHDPDVPGVGPLHAHAFAELPPWVPSLEEALEACVGMALNVEVKNGPDEPGYDPGQAVARLVAALLTESGPRRRRPHDASDQAPRSVVVSSFWPATVAAVRAAAPDVPVGLLTHPLLGPDAAVDAAAGLACAAVHLHHSQVSASSVDRAHGLDMAVVTWTVNIDADVHAVVRADVDVVITDRVATVRAALGRG